MAETSAVSSSPVTSTATTVLAYLSCGAFATHTRQDDIVTAVSTDGAKGVDALDDVALLKNAEDSTEAPLESEKQEEDVKPAETEQAEEQTMMKPADSEENTKEDLQLEGSTTHQVEHTPDDCTDSAKIEEKPEDKPEDGLAEAAAKEPPLEMPKENEKAAALDKASGKSNAKSAKKWFLPKSKWLGGKSKDQAKTTKTLEPSDNAAESKKVDIAADAANEQNAPNNTEQVTEKAMAKTGNKSFLPKWIGGKAKNQLKVEKVRDESVQKRTEPEDAADKPSEIVEKPTEPNQNKGVVDSETLAEEMPKEATDDQSRQQC